VVSTLVVDRHAQLATMMAASVSQVLDSYAGVLETLGSQASLGGAAARSSQIALEEANQALEVFNGGLVVVDAAGSVIQTSPDLAIDFGATISGREIFHALQADPAPKFTDLQNGANLGKEYFLVAVPLYDEGERFSGAMLGVVDLSTASFGEPLRQLTAVEGRHAYLLDRDGTIIFHPDTSEIGQALVDRAFVQEINAGQSGGLLLRAPDGERLVEGFAPVPGTEWGLVIQESWASVANSVRVFDRIMIVVGVVVTLTVLLLAWRSVERVTAPIQMLAEQSSQLARGKKIEPLQANGIQEIDALEEAFFKMARQINNYRNGLHRYVEAITDSQEEERRRIARELHDETVQSLLAIERHIELYQSQDRDPEHRQQLDNLRRMVEHTLQGVRQINRDLRPLILEDLGLAPALQTLVREAHQGVRAVDEVEFEMSGEKTELQPEQELALYRITQEALTNVRKHAQATHVKVSLAFETGQVRLQIEDDGVGFQVPPAMTDFARRDSFGIMGIQERALALGGSVEIQSSPEDGTCVLVVLPIRVD
jgi:two-component system sensor histidine kinase UhpB